MERVRFALVAALVLLLVSAAPALAQRDPFEPIDTQGSGGDSSGDSSGGGPFTQPQTGDSSDDTDTDTSGSNSNGDTNVDDPTQPDTNPAPDNDPEVDPADDTLPNTGAEPISWVVMAYSLIAIGVGFVVAGRFLHPAFVKRSEKPRRYQPRHSKSGS
jgi:hypothetical protein